MPSMRARHGVTPSSSVIGIRPSFTYSEPPNMIAAVSIFDSAKPRLEKEYVSGSRPMRDVSAVSVSSISCIRPAYSSGRVYHAVSTRNG